MQVLYDGRIYSMQTAGGINRYFANLIGKLPENFSPSLIVKETREVNFPEHPNLKIYTYGRMPLEHVSWKLGKLCSPLLKRFHENITFFKNFDVIHPTYYDLLTGRDLEDYRRPVVVTVYDMIHELFPDLFINDPTPEYKQRAVSTAQAVICISESTKKDLIDIYRVPEEKITVTHLATELNANMSYGLEQVPSRPYFLYVGSRNTYKNFGGLLIAFSKAFAAQPDIALCVVGNPFDEQEEKLVADLCLVEQVEHYRHASDSQLAKLYRCSVALVYPSLYEGFGIPPLEAMLCGTVVVASNCSSIPEVVGDAGVLFDPQSTDDLVDILRSLLTNPTERQRLITKGFDQAQSFSWAKTVSQTTDVYKSIQN